MLDSIRQAITDPASQKTIFIHMMGSHAAYENRYPDNFAQFSDNSVSGYESPLSEDEIDTINAYDNSILYSDYFIGEVLALLKNESGYERSLTYFSDHGEEVYQTARVKGHTPDNLTPAMMEIPFIVWTSTQDSTESKALKLNYDKPFMLDSLFHMALDLMNIQSELVINSQSPASTDYQAPEKRKVYNLVYEESFGHQSEKNSPTKKEKSL